MKYKEYTDVKIEVFGLEHDNPPLVNTSIGALGFQVITNQVNDKKSKWHKTNKNVRIDK